ELGQAFAQLGHARTPGLAAPAALGIFEIHAVGTGVLRDHQQFLHAALDQLLGFQQHLIHRARNQVAAHRRDDAEAAAVVAAFGNLQVRVVLRGELHSHRVVTSGVKTPERPDVEELVALGRQRLVHRVHHAGVVLRAADRKHVGVGLADQLRALAEAAGDDLLAVLVERGADGVQRLLHRRVDEAAGVHHHRVGLAVAGHDLVALHLELGEDALGIHQRLGATETYEADLLGGLGHGGRLPWQGAKTVDYT